MGQIIDAADIAPDAPAIEAAEVIIIGSGPAGAFTALRLLERGHNVLLIEAGRDLPDVDASPYFQFQSRGKQVPVEFGLSWQIGGTSNLWSGRCAPLEETDITAAKGWPFEYEAIAAHYEEAASILGLLPIADLKKTETGIADDDAWAALESSGQISIKRFQWNTPPFNTGTYLKDSLPDHSSFNMLSGCRLLSFERQDSTGQAISARFACGNNKTLDISGKVFVLCTGGIETPRILLNSDQGRGIGNASGLLGRFFSTHPKGTLGRLALNRPVLLASPMFSDAKLKNANLRLGLGLAQSSAGSGPLNHYVQFSGKFERIGTYFLEQAQAAFAALPSDQASGLAKRFHQRLNKFGIASGRALFNFLGKAGLWKHRANTLSVKAFLDQYPSRDCKVSLTGEPDLYGMSSARVEWRFSDQDIASIRELADALKDLFETYGIGKFTSALSANPEEWDFTAVHSHFLGTARMGADPKKSVVDQYGRLHDANMIYVCGSAVFPSYGNANPFLSIAAFSLRTAEKISADLKNGNRETQNYD
uniref:FAD-dependent oxidoreductase n=1 Tax=Pararhizobium sp. IMCC3301 TaxID=3067904 RepID=UPI0027424282|nr:FAD-dependent oxidoreductase [Pararhizobium sp. IMCC3301]